MPLNNKGSYITTLPIDFAGILRTNPPEIGIYEFGYDPVVNTLSANTITGSSAVITGSVNPAGNTVSTFFDWGKTTSYSTSTSGTPGAISGTSVSGFILTVTGLNPSTTYHYRARAVTAGGLIINGADAVFTTIADIPETITVSATTIIYYDTCFNASQTIIVAGSRNTFNVGPTGNITMIAGQNIRFLTGTVVQPGGYLQGYISDQYCGSLLQPVMATKVGQEKYNLNLSGHPVGFYLIRVISGNKAETVRIIKQ